MYYRMSRNAKYLGLMAICGPVVLLCQLAVFLVTHKSLILLLVLVFFIIRKSGIIRKFAGIIRKFARTLELFILDIPNFLPSYTFRRTFADRCGISFRKLRDNNYDTIKLDSISVEPLDETDIHAFRDTPAYKKMQAANKMNPIKQYASY